MCVRRTETKVPQGDEHSRLERAVVCTLENGQSYLSGCCVCVSAGKWYLSLKVRQPFMVTEDVFNRDFELTLVTLTHATTPNPHDARVCHFPHSRICRRCDDLMSKRQKQKE